MARSIFNRPQGKAERAGRFAGASVQNRTGVNLDVLYGIGELPQPPTPPAPTAGGGTGQQPPGVTPTPAPIGGGIPSPAPSSTGGFSRLPPLPAPRTSGPIIPAIGRSSTSTGGENYVKGQAAAVQRDYLLEQQRLATGAEASAKSKAAAAQRDYIVAQQEAARKQTGAEARS
ncbi:MAG TPA: hypothetical protein VFM38_13780, partial [Candidatus Limnocylindrales bacterium]|nr:hypothetical protein [Candidatus Limnocylindrales bacterium]